MVGLRVYGYIEDRYIGGRGIIDFSLDIFDRGRVVVLVVGKVSVVLGSLMEVKWVDS